MLGFQWIGSHLQIAFAPTITPFLTVILTTVVVSGGATQARRRRLLVCGGVHDEFPHILLWLEDDDVHLWGEEAQQGN